MLQSLVQPPEPLQLFPVEEVALRELCLAQHARPGSHRHRGASLDLLDGGRTPPLLHSHSSVEGVQRAVRKQHPLDQETTQRRKSKGRALLSPVLRNDPRERYIRVAVAHH